MKGRAPIKTGFICALVAALFATGGCTNKGIGVLPPKTIRIKGNEVVSGSYRVEKPYNQNKTYNATLINQATPKTGGPNSPEDDPAYKPD